MHKVAVNDAPILSEDVEQIDEVQISKIFALRLFQGGKNILFPPGVRGKMLQYLNQKNIKRFLNEE
jgi:hypothetical protein